jgi:hypothetical protein
MNPEVPAVGSQMMVQKAVLQAVQTRILVLPSQDKHIVIEALRLFQRINVELTTMGKRITDITVKHLAH